MSLANEPTTVTDADRAKAAEVLYPGLFRADAERLHPGQIARAAAALADARSLANEDETVTDADRAKAAEVVTQVWWAGAVRASAGSAADDLAATFGEIRADARTEADQLRDAMRALAEEFDDEANLTSEFVGRINLRDAAARVRDLADGGRR